MCNYQSTVSTLQATVIIEYLIPIKSRIYPAQKLKGASPRSTKARKLKGEEKMPQMNEKMANL